MNRNLQSALHEWYGREHRSLPWRETKDPYKIWVSEIILQQTRVAQGWDYYLRFIERFPTVSALAEATEADLLKMWQGLGYYARARNMHSAAKQIVEQHDATFPTDYPSIRTLKGIGEYTAAAIASFAFAMPYAAVDGNVYRVLSRLFGVDTPIDSTDGKREFALLADEMLDRQHPATHNQAMMELGALVCTPRLPHCDACPIRDYCKAFDTKNPSDYPVKVGKTKIQTIYLYYFDLQIDTHTYLQQRTRSGIWKGLFEFPSLEMERSLSLDEIKAKATFAKELRIVRENIKHQLSHRTIYATFLRGIPVETQEEWVHVATDRLDDYPVSRLTDRYLSEKFF